VGVTYFDSPHTAGVLGYAMFSGTWAAMAYADADEDRWGVYTPYDVYVGGTLRLPAGAADGLVLTSDLDGNASWEPPAGGFALPYSGSTISALPAFSVTNAGTGLAGEFVRDDWEDIVKVRAGFADGGLILSSGANWASISGSMTNHDDITIEHASGEVGIGGITEPQAQLHVGGDIRVDGISSHAAEITSDVAGSSTHVVHAEYTAPGAFDGVAIYGESTPEDYYGIGGEFVGGYNGVRGTVSPTGSYSYTGVYGSVNGGSGTNYGVYGYAIGSGTNYAGYFSGAIYATSASAGIKAFKIDHPVDPETKFLYHSSVESPDMKNVYDGTVVLDGNGEALVELPAYFEALNSDFRYQLTCIGGFAPVYVTEKISGNRFRVAGGEPGMEVSWQVTGIRHDALAEAQRIEVEVEKPVNIRGKYLNPEAYGLSKDMSIEHALDPKLSEEAVQEAPAVEQGRTERRPRPDNSAANQ